VILQSVWSGWILSNNPFLDDIDHLTLVLIPGADIFLSSCFEAFTGGDRRIERRFIWTLAGFQAANDNLMPWFIEQSR
jgi:hypothetical protein